jgi:hypothetical protein
MICAARWDFAGVAEGASGTGFQNLSGILRPMLSVSRLFGGAAETGRTGGLMDTACLRFASSGFKPFRNVAG